MPSTSHGHGIKLKELHLASTLHELNSLVDDKEKTLVVNGCNLKSLKNTAEKLFNEARLAKDIEQDEEKAYLFYMRFISLLRRIGVSKDADKATVSNQLKSKAAEAIDYSTALCDSLSRRYELKNHRREEESKANLPKPSPSTKNGNQTTTSIGGGTPGAMDTASIISKLKESSKQLGATITPKELKVLLEQKSEKILLIDVRSEQSYKEAHILAPEVICIPVEKLKAGLSANLITNILEGDDKLRWEQRKSYDRIVLYDDYSSKDSLEKPISIVFDAMTKWDVAIKYKSIQILDKGLNNFFHWYPFLLTATYVSRPNEQAPDTRTTLDHISYPGINDHVPKPAAVVGSNPTSAQPVHTNMNGYDHNQNGPKTDMDSLLEELDNVTLPTTLPHPSSKQAPPSRPTATKPSIPKLSNPATIPNETTPTPPRAVSPKPSNNNITFTHSQESLEPERESNSTVTPTFPPATTHQPKSTPNISLPLRPSAPKPVLTSSSVPERNGPSVTLGYGGRPASQDVGLSSSTYTKLKDEEDGLSNKSVLKRCHSNPDVSKMCERITNDTVTPAYNRTLKPSAVPETYTSTYKPRREFQAIGSSDFRTRTGLKNLGNTCYMNSILQCLNHTTELREYFLNYFKSGRTLRHSPNLPTKGEVTEEFAAAIKEMNAGHRSIAPSDLKYVIAKHKKEFAGSSQQDSHELLVILLDWLHEELNESSKSPLKEQKNDGLPDEEAARLSWDDYFSSHNSIISRLFCGQQRSCVRCQNCGKGSATFETFFNVVVPLPPPNVQRCTLQFCLDLYTKEEIIDWNCQGCKVKGKGTKKIDLWRLPPYLIVCFQRFFNDGYMKKKITDVAFPEYLDLSSKLHQRGKHSFYHLYGISNHYGNLETGHYTSICRGNDSNWYKFDDSDVYRIPVAQVTSSAAYIVFYESRNLSEIED